MVPRRYPTRARCSLISDPGTLLTEQSRSGRARGIVASFAHQNRPAPATTPGSGKFKFSPPESEPASRCLGCALYRLEYLRLGYQRVFIGIRVEGRVTGGSAGRCARLCRSVSAGAARAVTGARRPAPCSAPTGGTCGFAIGYHDEALPQSTRSTSGPRPSRSLLRHSRGRGCNAAASLDHVRGPSRPPSSGLPAAAPTCRRHSAHPFQVPPGNPPPPPETWARRWWARSGAPCPTGGPTTGPVAALGGTVGRPGSWRASARAPRSRTWRRTSTLSR